MICFSGFGNATLSGVATPSREKAANKTGSPDVALSYIGRTYRIESGARCSSLTPEQLVAERRDNARPISAEFFLVEQKGTSGGAEKSAWVAVNFTLGQWDKLLVYLDHPEMTLDNNRAEIAIRPFVVVRKNRLFSGSPKGAQASADLYSLIETAKANGLESYRYLRYLFEKLRFAETTEDCWAILPMRHQPEDVILGYPHYWGLIDAYGVLKT